MPFEKLTAGTTTSAISCLNDFWNYARTKGFFDLPAWTPGALQAILNGGMTGWIYRVGSRVDGVCLYRREQLVAPDSQVREEWMNIGYLAVRANTLGTTPARMKATFAAVKGAVTEGLRNTAAVGLTATFERGNTDLKALVDTWPVVMWEETDAVQRFWMRKADFLPRLDQHIADSGAGTV